MSGGVEAVSRQCRLTPVSVCRAVSGCSVGAVSGLLDSGDVRIVSRCQAVSECRGVGVSERCRGVGVSMPYTDGKHSLAKLQVSISEIKQYFHHDIWAAASCCGLQLQCG